MSSANGLLCLKSALAVATFSLLLACGKHDESGDVTWEGRHVIYHKRAEDDRACPTVVHAIDELIDTVAEFLVVDLPPAYQVHYHKYPTADDFRTSGKCATNALACTDGDAIYSYVPIDAHEFIHAVEATVTGVDLSPLFAEGTANALSCSPGVDAPDEWQWQSFDVSPSSTFGNNTAAAGKLMLALSAKLGPRALVELGAALKDSASSQEIFETVLERYGENLNDVWSTAVSNRAPTCIPLDVCRGTELEPGFTELEVQCDGPPRKLLPRLPGLTARLHFEGGAVTLRACSANPVLHSLDGLSLWSGASVVDYLVPLSDQSYALWIDDSDQDMRSHANVTFDLVGGAHQAACSYDSAYPLTVGRTAALVVTGERVLEQFTVSVDRPRPLSVYLAPTGTAVDDSLVDAPRVSFCASCVDGIAADCTQLDFAGRSLAVDVEGAYGVLVVEGSGSISPRVINVAPQYRDDE